MADARQLRGKVLQGTCGWSDSSIVKCGRFYPTSVKSTEDRLLYYSRFFPCVECDASNYAIPSPSTVEKWVKCVPAGFKFHFKAFGIFTRKVISIAAMPHIVRDELPASVIEGKTSIMWEELSQELQLKLWNRYNAALLPAYQKGKLGVIVFQFHLGFYPTDENKKHILECRWSLDVRYQMAVEFRSRLWLSDQNFSKTLDWLKKHNIGLVVADELKHELYFDKNKNIAGTKGSDPGDDGVVPIIMALGSRDFAYIRVHRRVGKHRILSESEIKNWGERLRSPDIQNNIQGPIFFMWGTDHEDQPIINSKNLSKELGSLVYDWKSKLSNTGLLRFCSKTPEEKTFDRIPFSDGEEKPTDEKVQKETTSNEQIKESERKAAVSPLITETHAHKSGESGLTASPTCDVDRFAHGCKDQTGQGKVFVPSPIKRSSTSSLVSPKKKRSTATLKGKFSTPVGQKTIAHFFKSPKSDS